jgi:hypothetical protein
MSFRQKNCACRHAQQADVAWCRKLMCQLTCFVLICRACSPAHGLPGQRCWRALHTLHSFTCMQYRAATVHTWFRAQSTNRIDVSCFGSASNPVRCCVAGLRATACQ